MGADPEPADHTCPVQPLVVDAQFLAEVPLLGGEVALHQKLAGEIVVPRVGLGLAGSAFAGLAMLDHPDAPFPLAPRLTARLLRSGPAARLRAAGHARRPRAG